MANDTTTTIAPQLLTAKEAAALVNCGERTLWRWSRSGVAPAPVKIGASAVRYRRDEYLDWIAAGCPRCNARKGGPR
jgi:predicted DNA-binding transcriptional regulator AlpA